jgi:hypothetical protein
MLSLKIMTLKMKAYGIISCNLKASYGYTEKDGGIPWEDYTFSSCLN